MSLLLDISLFFGRFHPLVVHLPIGFLLLAAALEMVAWRRDMDLRFSVEFALLLGAVSGVVACVFGWLLASDGGYQETNLALHRWLGIGTTALSVVVYWLKRGGRASVSVSLYRAMFALLIFAVGGAGHYGGSLTHGSTYLVEYAPEPIRKLAGLTPKRDRQTSLEEALMYEDGIQYIFDDKCTACHNPDKAKGELLLTSAELLMAGGESGEVLVPGDAQSSEVYRRVILDPNHEDFMPAEGRTPMTKAEVSLLAWWIDNGAPLETPIATMDRSETIDLYLKEIGIGVQPSFISSLSLPPVAQSQWTAAEQAGFSSHLLVANTGMLDVKAKMGVTSLDLEALLPIREHIVWLSLSGAPIVDADMEVVAQFPNLVRLKLDQTEITDEGVARIGVLEHLEQLNLYGTPVSDDCLDVIRQMPSLTKLFIWQTDISEEGRRQLSGERPELEIVGGEGL